MVKTVLRSAEKFSEPFPPLSATPLPLSNVVLVIGNCWYSLDQATVLLNSDMEVVAEEAWKLSTSDMDQRGCK